MSVPSHVGIIMDGNRRFAKRSSLLPWKGHEAGARKLEEALDWCNDFGVKELTVYALSVQNFKRSAEEIDFLMKLFSQMLEKILAKITAGTHAIGSVAFIGRLSLFSADLQENMRIAMEKTASLPGLRLNICLGYGGREEIVDAVRALCRDVQAGLAVDTIDEAELSKHLYLQSEPDLVIRTGGEHRTSNFLLWQSYYAEWFFVEKLWPEFTKADFEAVLAEYAVRERRFGS